MVMQPPNACEVCWGTNWTNRVEVDSVKDPTEILSTTEVPCPKCNPHGTKPKIQY